jgi:hypothetical protein
MCFTDCAILRQITSGLPHHPNRDASQCFTVAGAEEEVFAINLAAFEGRKGV